MSDLLFPAPPLSTIPVTGEARLFPVHRVFCVGRNYAEHAKEMGQEVDREAPFYFTKSALAVKPTGQSLPYPLGTENFHYEMELVIALGGNAFHATVKEAQDAVYGYACGLDMTRRDLQLKERSKQRPWDLGKDFENSAVIAPITRKDALPDLGTRQIQLAVNGSLRQSALVADMVWGVEEIICHLSRYYHLHAGDVIFTGTPAGVGPVLPGDVIEGSIDGLSPVRLTIGERQLREVT